MKPFIHFLVESLFRFRVLVGLLTLVGVAIALAGAARLRFDDRVRDLFRSEGPETMRLQNFLESFGSDDNDCLVVLESEELLQPPQMEVLRIVASSLQDVEAVESVQSLFSARRPRRVGRYLLPAAPDPDASPQRFANAIQTLREHPLVKGHLLSPDGQTTLMIVRLKGQSLSLTQLNDYLGQVRLCLHQQTAGSKVRFRLTGIPALRLAIVGGLQRDQLLFNAVTLALSSLAAWLLFRRVSALLLIGVGPVVGLAWTLGALGLMGFKITPISSIAPPIILVIGFADAAHVLFHLRRRLRAGDNRHEAARSALRKMWVPCGLTSLTTAVGFGSLALTQLPSLREFGLACAMGAGLTYIAVMLITPLLASTLLGDRLLAPRLPRRWRLARRNFREGVLRTLQRHNGKIVAGGAAATLALLPCWFALDPDNRVGEFMPRKAEEYAALEHCEKVFGGALFVHVLVSWPSDQDLASEQVLARLREVHELLERQPNTHYPLSVLQVLDSLPGADMMERIENLSLLPPDSLRRLVREDLRQTVVSAKVADLGGALHEPHFRRLEEEFAEIASRHPGFTISLTGATVTNYRGVNRMIEDLAASLTLAAAIIFTSMTITLGSWRLGLISILPNLLPMVGVAALLYFTGLPLQYATVVVFSVCIALTVDDTIHFLTSFKSHRGAVDVSAAAAATLSKVGLVLIVSTLIMLCGFGSLLLSDLPPLKRFGMLACAALILALLADLIFLPALLMRFAPKTIKSSSAVPEEEAAPQANSIPCEIAT